MSAVRFQRLASNHTTHRGRSNKHRSTPTAAIVKPNESWTPCLIEENLQIKNQTFLPLQTPWSLWIHPNDTTDWSIQSYLQVCIFSTVQGFWTVFNHLKLHPQFNYFLMRRSILPVWEDSNNTAGGAYSLQVESGQGSDLWLD